MKITYPTPEIAHATFATRKDMTMAFARIQEFYESPHSNIRGKYFSWEEFMRAHCQENGTVTYFSEWEGFNISRKTVTAFKKLFFNLTGAEKAIVDVFNCADINYLIGTDAWCDPTTLAHEMAHAHYFLNKEYREQVDTCLSCVPVDLRHKFEKGLAVAGYSKEHNVYLDEVHAYLKTADAAELYKVFPDCGTIELASWREQLKAINV